MPASILKYWNKFRSEIISTDLIKRQDKFDCNIQGGIDFYTNAISDIYQDNFEEGIFTGKGIYDIDVYNEILKNEIPENIVLSHASNYRIYIFPCLIRKKNYLK